MVHTSSSSFTLHLPLSRRDWTSCNLPSSAAISRSLSSEALDAACVISTSQSMKDNGRYMTEVRVRPGMHIRIWRSRIMVQIKSQAIYYTILLVSLVLGQEQVVANKEGKKYFQLVCELTELPFVGQCGIHPHCGGSKCQPHIAWVVRLREPFCRWHKLKWKSKLKYIFVTCWEVTSKQLWQETLLWLSLQNLHQTCCNKCNNKSN